MKIDISIGELLDKVSILAIKLEKVKDPGKLVNIQKEYDILGDAMVAEGIGLASPDFLELLQINRELWCIEDVIRLKEANKSFDVEFIALARSVYFTNDERAEVKKAINLKFGSDIIEEKEYVEYNRLKDKG